MAEIIKKRLDDLVAGGAIRDAQGHIIHKKYAKISEVPDIINDSELNEYMLSSGTYKPLTNNENNIFKLNDNTILIL